MEQIVGQACTHAFTSSFFTSSLQQIRYNCYNSMMTDAKVRKNENKVLKRAISTEW